MSDTTTPASDDTAAAYAAQLSGAVSADATTPEPSDAVATVDGPEHAAQPTRQGFGAEVAKAWAGGIAGAAVAVGAAVTHLGDLFPSTGPNGPGIAAAAGAVVAGFVGGFLAVFFPTNKVYK